MDRKRITYMDHFPNQYHSWNRSQHYFGPGTDFMICLEPVPVQELMSILKLFLSRSCSWIHSISRTIPGLILALEIIQNRYDSWNCSSIHICSGDWTHKVLKRFLTQTGLRTEIELIFEWIPSQQRSWNFSRINTIPGTDHKAISILEQFYCLDWISVQELMPILKKFISWSCYWSYTGSRSFLQTILVSKPILNA